MNFSLSVKIYHFKMTMISWCQPLWLGKKWNHIILNKISNFEVSQYCVGSQMLGWNSDSLERQKKHPASLPPQVNLNSLQIECPFLLFPVCHSTQPPDSLLLSMVFFFAVFSPCQRVACSSTWPMGDFI